MSIYLLIEHQLNFSIWAILQIAVLSPDNFVTCRKQTMINKQLWSCAWHVLGLFLLLEPHNHGHVAAQVKKLSTNVPICPN